MKRSLTSGLPRCRAGHGIFFTWQFGHGWILKCDRTVCLAVESRYLFLARLRWRLACWRDARRGR